MPARDRSACPDGRARRPGAGRGHDPREPRALWKRQRAPAGLAGRGRRSRPSARALAGSAGAVRRHSASRSTASRKRSSIAAARRRSFSQTERPRGLECLPRERFVDLARQAAHADCTHPCLALERGDPAEEEREERIEALALDSVLAHLLRQLSRRTRVAPRGGVRLPLRVQARVRRAPSIVAAATSSPCVSATKTETGPDASRTTKSTIACACSSFTKRFYGRRLEFPFDTRILRRWPLMLHPPPAAA